MEITVRKGVGYSIEAVLTALILFTFAYGAVDSPNTVEWSEYQDSISARDLTYMAQKSGDLDKFLRTSNLHGLQTEINSISGRNLGVSGTVRNLPLGEFKIGFHKSPSKIHINDTTPVTSGDRCDGNLGSINSEFNNVLRTNNSVGSLEKKHDTRLYFADTDNNGQRDYDALWVDNGTQCVFEEEEGPYDFNEIFLWGNTSSSDSLHYEFKSHSYSKDQFTVFEAPKAARFKKSLNRPMNGIQTEPVINTLNFSSSSLGTYDVLVFQQNTTLPTIQSRSSMMKSLASNTSYLLLMNMTESDLNYDFIQDIGFKYTPMSINSPSSGNYETTFSNYGVSEDIESYFLGLGGKRGKVSLKPGGQVISNQGSTETSRNDVLFARNIQYDSSKLHGLNDDGTWNNLPNCNDHWSMFEVPDENYVNESINVTNVDTKDSCGGKRGLEIDKNGNGDFSGPYLKDEILTINGRRYSPDISGNTDATLEFVGSKKVELINHRRTMKNFSGQRVARISYQERYNQADIGMITSTLYWLIGDSYIFQNSEDVSSIFTRTIGGINEKIFMPYKLELRWER